MASIETQPSPKEVLPPPPAPKEPNRPEPEFHLLIADLQDDNSRSRMREAIWISIIMHLVFLFGVRQAPYLFPKSVVALLSPEQQMRQQELTYLEQPPDRQRLKTHPETNKISDKDRMATSKNPQIDRQALEQLAASRRQGMPGPPAPQSAPPQMTAQNQPPSPAAGQPQQQQPPRDHALDTPQQRAANIFRDAAPVSAHTAIEQAARASSQTRSAGSGGEYGAGPGRINTATRNDFEVLTDTMGVDFGPYIQRVLHAIRTNWYNVMPESVYPPLRKQGVVMIDFYILPNGTVTGMTLRGPSGDVALDRAAWSGISASNPFSPLPKEFTGASFGLRIKFLYNPNANDLQ